MAETIENIPLVLDVDGTLIRGDLTVELFMAGLARYPFKILTFLYLLLTSKPKLKVLLVSLVGDEFQAEYFPYNEEVVARAKAAKAEGREVVLASGSQEKLIAKIGGHLDWLDGAYGTNETVNLVKGNKANFLKEKYPQGFDYFGNSTQDYEVWKEARHGYAIEPPAGVKNIRSQGGEAVEIIEPRKSQLKAIFKTMRLHQWAKNILIFLVPILVIDQVVGSDVVNLLWGFLAMGLLASGTYILNDLVDIQADRQHTTKKNRPLASGRLSVKNAGLAMIICLALAGLVTVSLPRDFAVILAIYFITTLSYSFFLKRQIAIDVLTLALLFLIRVVAGAEIIDRPLSPWLVSFVATFFLGLSLVKRYTELIKLSPEKAALAGRGYRAADKPLVLGFGMMAFAMSILSLILYGVIADEPVLRNPVTLTLLVAILTYWLMRIWLLAHRGELDDDPVLFALRDKLSLLLGGIIFAAVLIERLHLL